MTGGLVVVVVVSAVAGYIKLLRLPSLDVLPRLIAVFVLALTELLAFVVAAVVLTVVLEL